MTAGKTCPVWHYDHLSVYTADNIIVRVISASPMHQSTPSGINVGASLETIIETYENPDESLQEKDEHYMEYRYYDKVGLCLQFTIFKETGKQSIYRFVGRVCNTYIEANMQQDH